MTSRTEDSCRSVRTVLRARSLSASSNSRNEVQMDFAMRLGIVHNQHPNKHFLGVEGPESFTKRPDMFLLAAFSSGHFRSRGRGVKSFTSQNVRRTYIMNGLLSVTVGWDAHCIPSRGECDLVKSVILRTRGTSHPLPHHNVLLTCC